MRRGGVLFAVILTLLLAGRVALAEELTVRFPEVLRPFEEAQLIVLAPEAGTLSVEIEGAYGQELPVAQNVEVKRGAISLPYSATSFGGMPLRAGSYTLHATLAGASGTYSAQALLTVDKPIATLEYALPSSPFFYQRQAGAWFVDCSVTGGCTVHLEIFADEAMTKSVLTIRKKLKNGGQFRIPWKGKNGDRTVAAGSYWCRVYAAGQSSRAFSFPLDIRSGKPDIIPLAETGTILPATLDDQAVWDAMMAPLVVVDIDAVDHQRIYAEPDPKSAVVGRVHGQSQGLEVVQVGERYALVRAWRHEDGQPVEGYVPTKKLKVVTPNPHYGLLIDKGLQQMTVYEYAKPIATLSVTTGLMDTDKLFRETRAGAFMTTDRVTAFESNGFWYDYPIRIDGGNLIHQLGYERIDGMADFTKHVAQLGQKASDGCVRMDYRTDATHPVNAYWLWTHLEYGTKVLVLDDPEQRVARMVELN